MTQLDYAPAPGFFDELFEAPGVPRPSASALTTVLGRLGRERLRSAAERRDAIFVQQGITFDASRTAVPAATARSHSTWCRDYARVASSCCPLTTSLRTERWDS
jgi:uncharacterized circularly permuted ATP-grasp superfamily protein